MGQLTDLLGQIQGGDAKARDALFVAAYAERGKKGVVLDVDTLVTPMDVLSRGGSTGEETWGNTDSSVACRTSPKAAGRERRVRVKSAPRGESQGQERSGRT
jgi:hypothetical protein